MHQLDELKAFIAGPNSTTHELQELLRNSEEQLGLYDQARRVIHDAGPEGWSYDVFQESLRVAADSDQGTLTKAEWDAMRADAQLRLRDRSLRTINEGRKTFEELRTILEKELARREAEPGRPASGAPAVTPERKKRWFRKS